MKKHVITAVAIALIAGIWAQVGFSEGEESNPVAPKASDLAIDEIGETPEIAGNPELSTKDVTETVQPVDKGAEAEETLDSEIPNPADAIAKAKEGLESEDAVGPKANSSCPGGVCKLPKCSGCEKGCPGCKACPGCKGGCVGCKGGCTGKGGCVGCKGGCAGREGHPEMNAPRSSRPF